MSVDKRGTKILFGAGCLIKEHNKFFSEVAHAVYINYWNLSLPAASVLGLWVAN